MATILFFGIARELAGTSQTQCEIGFDSTTEDVWNFLSEKFPTLTPHRKNFILAVNRVYTAGAIAVRSGDEIAVIPPVSGG